MHKGNQVFVVLQIYVVSENSAAQTKGKSAVDHFQKHQLTQILGGNAIHVYPGYPKWFSVLQL